MRRVLVLGATSAIAQQVARLYADRGAELFLVARNEERLGAVADDLRVRGASVETAIADLDDPARHDELLARAAQRLEAQGSGCIAALSSVAGDRGRGSNLVYGAAKAGLTAFLSGLRNRLSGAGVRVVTVKPGFVDTPMTDHLPKNPLYASPERVARDVVRAIEGGADVVYTPWWWRWVMLAVRLVPERLFKRLSL